MIAIARKLFTLLVFLSSLLFSVDCNADTYIVNTKSGQLNVRTAPKRNAGLICTFSKGEKVDVMEINNGWAKLRLEDDETGYAKAEYLMKAKHSNTPSPDSEGIMSKFNELRSHILKLSDLTYSSRIDYANSTIATIALIVFTLCMAILLIMEHSINKLSKTMMLIYTLLFAVSVGAYIVMLPSTACWLDETWGYFISVVIFGMLLYPYYKLILHYIYSADGIGDVDTKNMHNYLVYFGGASAIAIAPCVMFRWGVYDYIIIGYILISTIYSLWITYKSWSYEGAMAGLVVGLSFLLMSMSIFALLMSFAIHSLIAVITIMVIYILCSIFGRGSDDTKYPCKGYLTTKYGERIEGTFLWSTRFEEKYGGYYDYINGEWVKI